MQYSAQWRLEVIQVNYSEVQAGVSVMHVYLELLLLIHVYNCSQIQSVIWKIRTRLSATTRVCIYMYMYVNCVDKIGFDRNLC